MSKFDKASFRRNYDRTPPNFLPIEIQTPAPIRLKAPEYHNELVSLDNFDRVLSEIRNAKRYALDTETNGLCYDGTKVVGWSFTLRDKDDTTLREDTLRSYYVPVFHVKAGDARSGGLFNGVVEYYPECLPLGKSKELQKALFDKECLSFLFNAEFDLVQLRENGYRSYKDSVSDFVDVQALVYLLDMFCQFGYNSLKKNTLWFLGWQQQTFKETLGEGVDNFERVSPTDACYYACGDTFATMCLGEKLYPAMQKHYDLFMRIEKRLTRSFPEFHREAFRFDKGLIESMTKELLKQSSHLSNKLATEWGLINANSSAQIVAIMEKHGKDTKVKTDKGTMSVKKKALEKLTDWPFVADLQKLRNINSMCSKIFVSTLERLNLGFPMRFLYFRFVAPTYRLSSRKVSGAKEDGGHDKYFSGINVQAISKPTIVKRVLAFNRDTLEFVWDTDELRNTDGWVTGLIESGLPFLNFREAWLPTRENDLIVNIDYASIEMVLAAYLSGERVWVDAWENNQDLHEMTGRAIYGVAYDSNLRKPIKIHNFKTMYGGTVHGIVGTIPGVNTLKEAEVFLDQYWRGLPSLDKFVKDTQNAIRGIGILKNCYGLPRSFRGMYGKGGGSDGYTLRQGVNYLIQSAGAVMMRMSLCKFYDLTQEDKYKGKVSFLASVHDAIAFSVDKDLVHEVTDRVCGIMLGLLPKRLENAQIRVTPEYGYSYGCMVEVEKEKEGEGKWLPVFEEVFDSQDRLAIVRKEYLSSMESYRHKALLEISDEEGDDGEEIY